MHLVDNTIALPPPPPPPPIHTHLGAMLAMLTIFGELADFRVAFNGNRGSVTFMVTGGRRGRGGGSHARQGRLREAKAAAQLWAVLSGNRSPASPVRGLGASILLLRAHLGRHQLNDQLYSFGWAAGYSGGSRRAGGPEEKSDIAVAATNLNAPHQPIIAATLADSTKPDQGAV